MALRVVLMILSVTLLGFAPAPFPKPDRTRQDPLSVNGTWEFVRSETRGQVDPPSTVEYLLEMTQDSCVFAIKGGTRTPFQMRLDPTVSPPSFTWGQNDSVGYVGSYRLHKDELTMIFTTSGRLVDRPTDFTGAAPYKYVLRRIRRN